MDIDFVDLAGAVLCGRAESCPPTRKCPWRDLLRCSDVARRVTP